jgi:hypothetical protein
VCTWTLLVEHAAIIHVVNVPSKIGIEFASSSGSSDDDSSRLVDLPSTVRRLHEDVMGARGTFRVAAVGILALSACASQRTATKHRAVGPSSYWSSQAALEMRAAPDLLDFAAAVGDYGSELQRVELVPEAEPEKGLRPALGKLAAALRDIPYAPRDLTMSAVLDIRSEQANMAIDEPSERDEVRAALSVLDLASVVFAQLASGPYRSDPDVVTAAAAVEQEVRALRDPERLRVGRRDILKALELTRVVLDEMRIALDEQTAPAPS